MVYEWLGPQRTLVSIAGREPTSDEDWLGYMDTVRNHVDEDMCVLAISVGALPNRAQQSQLMALPNHHKRRVAVINDSIAIRFIISVFLLAAPQLKLFSPAQLNEAIVFLGHDAADAAVVRACVERLRQRLKTSARAA